MTDQADIIRRSTTWMKERGVIDNVRRKEAEMHRPELETEKVSRN
jgi:hypothetical protein